MPQGDTLVLLSLRLMILITQFVKINAFIYTECKCASITAFYLKLDLNPAFIFLMKELKKMHKFF